MATMRGPERPIHNPPKKAAQPRAKIVMLNVMLVAVTDAPYCCDSGSRNTLQAYTAPRATCITTPATAINALFPTPAPGLAAWLVTCFSLPELRPPYPCSLGLPSKPVVCSNPRSRSGINPLGRTIYVEPFASQETNEGHVESPRHVHREAARGGDRAHDGHPGREALLQDLEAAAPADHDDVIAQGQPPLEKSPSEELVGGVVAADVLPQRHEPPLRVEERGSVQPARRLEEPLRLTQLLRQGVDGLCGYLRSGWDHGAPAQLELLQASLAAHAAGARGVEVALQEAGVVVVAAAELHVYDVVALLGIHVGVDAVADPSYVLGGGDHALAVQEPGGELEVGARRSHGYGDGQPGAAGDEAHLHRFLGS